MRLNDTLELRIVDMLEDGRAFGRADGLAVFVSGGCIAKDGTEYVGAVPGDVVTAEITKLKKNSAEAVLKSITELSPDRIAAECPYFVECGGCTLQELSYDAQLRLKQEQVKAKLERLGEVQDPKVNEPIAADSLKYYRNKATFAVGPHGEVGFMKGKSHFVMDVEDCMLQSDAAMVCADALRAFLRGYGKEDSFEDDRREEAHTSENRRIKSRRASKGKKNGKSRVKTPLGITQMVVRTAFGTGEVMVVLESERKEIPGIELLIEMLDDAVFSINAQNVADEAARLEFADLADDCKYGKEEKVSENDHDNDNDSVIYTLESVAVVYGTDLKKGQLGKCTIVAGKPAITDELVTSDGGAVKYEISPQSFFQVNPEQMVKLYDKAAEYTGLLPGEGSISERDADDNPEADAQKPITILDLYCGAGTIGIWLLKTLQGRFAEKQAAANVNAIEARTAEADGADKGMENAFSRVKVIGIESVKPAVIDANRNSVINGLVSTRYICGRAEEELPGMMGLAKLYKWNEVNERVEREPEIRIEKADVVILDPPRAGCGEALLAAVAAAQPDRLVYVSCDPGTLARDIKYLTAHGYDFIEATPVDMFPWTSHVETVVLMSRVEGK